MGYFSLPEDTNDPVELVKTAIANLKLFLQTSDPRNDPYLYLLPFAEHNIRRAREILTEEAQEKLNENRVDN